MNFGEYLRDLRKEKNLSMTKLEKTAGVSSSYIANIENGKRGIPSPEVLSKLAKALGVDHTLLLMKAGHLKEVESGWGNGEELDPRNRFAYVVMSKKDLYHNGQIISQDVKEVLINVLDQVYPK